MSTLLGWFKRKKALDADRSVPRTFLFYAGGFKPDYQDPGRFPTVRDLASLSFIAAPQLRVICLQEVTVLDWRVFVRADAVAAVRDVIEKHRLVGMRFDVVEAQGD